MRRLRRVSIGRRGDVRKMQRLPVFRSFDTNGSSKERPAGCSRCGSVTGLRRSGLWLGWRESWQDDPSSAMRPPCSPLLDDAALQDCTLGVDGADVGVAEHDAEGILRLHAPTNKVAALGLLNVREGARTSRWTGP